MNCVIDLLTKIDLDGNSGEYKYTAQSLKGIDKIKINIEYLNGIGIVASAEVKYNTLIMDISYNVFLRSVENAGTPNEFKEYLFDILEGVLYHELTHGKIDSQLEFKGIDDNRDMSLYYTAEDYINEHSGEINNIFISFAIVSIIRSIKEYKHMLRRQHMRLV